MQQQRAVNLWLVWGALVTSQLVISGLTTVMPPASPPDAQMAAILGVTALGPAGASLVAGRLVGITAPAQTKWILRWALAEAVTLTGFVSWMIGGLAVPAYCTMAAGFVLHLVQFPRDEA